MSQEDKNNDVLIAGIDSLRSQVTLLQKRTTNPDDLTHRLFDNVLLATESIVCDVNARLDAEMDEYNNLVDRFEAFQADANKALQAISVLVKQDVNVKNCDDLLSTWVAAQQNVLEQAGIQLQQANIRRSSVEAELREYKKIYPVSLVTRMERAEKETRELRKERRELKETNTQLNQKFVKATANLVSARKKLVEAEGGVEALKTECYRLGEELNTACGMADRPETFPMMYKGRDAIGYLHSFPHGLSAVSTLRGEVLISANVHYQIRTNWLLTMDVIPSIWGIPLYFRMPGFAEEWNTDIDECLAEKIMAFIERDFPRLHSRICSARTAPVTELKMRVETLAEVMAANFNTVHSVACIPAEFHENIPFMQGDHRQEIIDACRVWANEWDKANGGVEELYDANYRAVVSAKKIR